MKPLEGVKILDFTQFFSGPLCTMILADYGAEVIKLENPPYGDNTRYNPGLVCTNGIHASTNFAGRNRGKKSVLMDLKDERQKALFLEMVKTADAVVENFKPGTMDKFGLGYERLREINPKIVYTSISGYGHTGPWKSRAAYDLAVQASSGIMSVTGEKGGEPLKVGASVGDFSGGLFGCIGTLLALYGAKATGEGRYVDVAMMDSLVVLLDNILARYCLTGKIPKPEGNRHPVAVPFCPFNCRNDEKVVVGISTDEQWAKFCNILKHPEWIDDPNCVTFARRSEHGPEIEAMIADVLKNWNASELCDEMERERLVYAQINNVEQVVHHPQTIARNMVVKAQFPNGGPTLDVPGRPIKMSGVEDETVFSTPALGYDTISIMSRYAAPEVVHSVYDAVLKSSEESAEQKYAKT